MLGIEVFVDIVCVSMAYSFPQGSGRIQEDNIQPIIH